MRPGSEAFPAPALAPGVPLRWVLAAGLAVAATACETSPSRGRPAAPLPGTGQGQGEGWVDHFYGSILAQCQEAYGERDIDRLSSLLGMHQREDAPAWAKDRLALFSLALAGLRFQEHALGFAGLASARSRVAMGEEIPLVLRLDSSWEEPLTLHARDRGLASCLYLEIRMRDEDGRGSSLEDRRTVILPLKGDIALLPGESRSVPFPFPTDGNGVSIVRTVEFSGNLVLARLTSGDRTLPVHRVPLASCRVQVLPPGYEPIEEAPLDTLREALDRNDPRLAAHVYVASLLLRDEDLREAGDLLAGVLRTGTPEVQEVALASLERIFGAQVTRVFGAEVPVKDRDGWLAWWQEHRERF